MQVKDCGRETGGVTAVAKILRPQLSASLEWVQKTEPFVAGLRKMGLKWIKNEELKIKNDEEG